MKNTAIKAERIASAPMAEKNDTWETFNRETYSKLEISVFNRWRQVIFNSFGYDIPWEDTYKGTTVPAGSYPYKICSDGNLIKYGAVNIIH